MPEGCLIYDYVDIDGTNVVQDWLSAQQIRVRAKITTRLNYLDQTPQSEWGLPYTEVLHGDKDGLVAVRSSFGKIAPRLLGYFGPTRNTFTILACCTERGDKYIPLSIGETAFKRKTLVEANPSSRRVRHAFR